MKYNDFEEFDEVDFGKINIEDIVDEGLKGNKGFFDFLQEVKRELGFKYIFHDKSELIFLVLILLLTLNIFGVSVTNFLIDDGDFIYKLKGYTFLISPVIYFAICSYSFFSSRINGTFEIEHTCKYNFYNLTAIRMFMFSIACTLINTLLIVIMYFGNRNFDLLSIVIMSISALFMFSLIYLMILIYIKGRTYKYLAFIGWIILSVFLINNVNMKFVQGFFDVPIYIHIGITVLACTYYIKNLRKLIKVKKGDN